MLKKGILAVIIVILIIGGSAAYHFGAKMFLPIRARYPDQNKVVLIRNGLPVSAIADSLQYHGIIARAHDFVFTTRLFKTTSRLKAGRYVLPAGISCYQAMKQLEAGKSAGIRVVIPEGVTSYYIASLLSKKLGIDSTAFINLVHNPMVCQNLGVKAQSLEGYLFPNTYYFDWGTSEDAAIRILVREWQRYITDSLQSVALEKGWSLHQVLTLASIIEGEAMVDSERALVSAVYHNRLQRGMLLQADPTIQYIIPDGPRRLLNRDLKIDSPYNTYLYPGLPPGPVNNPGLRSIMAALNPAPVDYVYLVAKGDGTHIFSRTLRDHQIAKQKFDAYRRIVNQKRRGG